MRALILSVTLLLAGCGEAVEDNHFADDVRQERPASAPVTTEAVPVRIGELGPSFPACSAVGVTRNLEAGASLAVRAAPFDTAEETGRVPSGGRFFVCTRSHDQKWFGIVFGQDGQACGVSTPATSRRIYEGPCRSGWVASPFVKLSAGGAQPQPLDSEPQNAL
jgi:hypothetical protein